MNLKLAGWEPNIIWSILFWYVQCSENRKKEKPRTCFFNTVTRTPLLPSGCPWLVAWVFIRSIPFFKNLFDSLTKAQGHTYDQATAIKAFYVPWIFSSTYERKLFPCFVWSLISINFGFCFFIYFEFCVCTCMKCVSFLTLPAALLLLTLLFTCW